MATPLFLLLAASFCLAGAGAAGAAGKAAIFEFEIRGGDPVPGAPQKREAEEQRLHMVTERLREHFAASGYGVVDTAPVAERAATINLESCSACADGMAEELGADLAVTGVVYKVSELILSMNVRVHDAKTAAPLTSAVVDIRGNTDESWHRAVDYLYKRMLSARLERLPR